MAAEVSDLRSWNKVLNWAKFVGVHLRDYIPDVLICAVYCFSRNFLGNGTN